ncbi:Receptor like protein 53, putative [Theobroma cacao]|uniref:Receptor like protein 53, putative n=1 Tax=Theobroma cacao TaxID=3641 RepID=A0A061EXQ2_THECC|nr:Receptor like protein 53, putative [Theobroma cacao]
MRSLLWNYQFLCLLLLFYIYAEATTSSSFTSSTPGKICSHNEAAALLQFKQSFLINSSASFTCDADYGIRSYPKTDSWEESTDCCSWDGVTCDSETGQVIGLDLSCSRLYGTIPSNSSIFLLQHLKRLDLSFNDFRNSKISAGFGRFGDLTHLNLSNSLFSGQVPSDISRLSKLISLDLSSFKPLIPDDSQLKLETTALERLVQNLGEVQEFYLDRINMSSVDPSYLMKFSSSLTSLSLRNCELRGKIPESIFQFPNLKFIDLGINQELAIYLPKSNWTNPLEFLNLESTEVLEGLPDSIGNLRSLQFLNLIGCNLQGSIPSTIGNLSEVIALLLSFNNFSGQIPPSVVNLPQLIDLDMSHNQLGGPIPYHASGLSKLVSLYFSDNFLIEAIPSWVLNLPSLQNLYLGNNRFTGDIQAFQSKSLTTIDFGNNRLHGHIPSSIFKLANLALLDLSFNNFSGIVELDMFSELKNLEWLDLSHNNLSLSKNIKVNYTLPKLSSLFLASCNLSEFPNFLRGNKVLIGLDLSENRIHGQIPKWMWDVGKNTLSYLSLSQNFLNGSVEFPWLNILSLQLQFNMLQGVLPEFMKGCQLKALNFNGNRFEGDLPQSLVNCRSLEVLDLGNNNMKGTFPYWLETLPELQVLVLSSNKFHGFVPKSKARAPFPKLRVLDLSNNGFVGPLPAWYIENLKAMAYLDEGYSSVRYMQGSRSYNYSLTLTIKGFTMQLVRILTIFTSIDLSNNNFEGVIPEVLGKLSALKGLNLSSNKIGGDIPPSLGNLTQLEWLDLSSNELVGKIPEELVDLIFLSFIDLSDNQLVGSIPQGKQFNTFENSSYEGNFGLCGRPLSKSCNETPKPPSPTLPLEDDSKSGIRFGWKVALMGYGCGFIFGAAAGYLVFQTGKPKWFINLVGVKQHQKVKKSKQKKATRRAERRN